jgi:hypothetical protein
MDFETFIGQAWTDHAEAPQAVADRLGEATALAGDEGQLNQLMNLAHHVHGEHLGAWPQGIAFIEHLSTAPAFVAGGASGQAARRFIASLRLSGGQADGLDALTPSDRIRVLAMAAANLGSREPLRAGGLLRDALDLAQRTDLPANDPMNRALAVTGNNIACTLEEKPERSADERDLMILAAQTTRRHWAIAGTWLETERAEYRLANTWLQAGDLVRAREHAQACLEIVAAHDGAALERLFGWEALGLVERAAGNATGHAQALARAREAFAELDEADKSWCAASIDKLAAAAPD